MTEISKRKRLERLLSQQKIIPKKFNYGNKQVVVLPSPIQKRDLTDYDYAKNIDEKVIKMAVGLAEKMAISIVRETLSLNVDSLADKIIKEVSEKIAEALPEQQTIIQQIVSEEAPLLKKEMQDFAFEGANLNIDRSKGLKLHGKVGEKTESTESTDDALDALADLL